VARRRARGRHERRELGQRLLVEGVDEDGLDGVIAILADSMGAGAGGVEPGRAVALAQAEDALGAAEAIEGPITEQDVDEQGAGGADAGGLGPAPGGGLQEEVDLVGWQVGGQGAPLAGAGRPMGGDQRVVMEALDLAEGGADPEALADQAIGGGVVGAGEDDMAVGMQLGPLPLDQVPRRGRQGLQRGALELVEDLQRDALDGAMDPAARGLNAPAPQVAVAVMEIAEGAAGPGRCA